MYAVIRTGGKQYRVAQGDLITVERLTAEPGSLVRLGEVLAMGSGSGLTLGSPLIEGAAVTAEVVDQTRGPKIIVFKKKRRQNYRRKKGHRQDLTLLRIRAIGDGVDLGQDAPLTDAAPTLAKTTPATEGESPAAAATDAGMGNDGGMGNDAPDQTQTA